MKDEFTSPPGHKLFLEALQGSLDRAAQRQRMLGLLVVRIWRMHEININAGYSTGDLLVVGLAHRIGEILREVDKIALIGDAEYAIILPELTSDAQAELAASRIIQMCQAPFLVRGHEIKLNVGVGVALHPVHANSPEGLLRCAEIALGYSNNSPTGYCIYSVDMEGTTGVSTSYALERALAQAVDRRELQIYVQPKLHLRTKRLGGVEALLRWTRGNGESVEPSIFIPLAERSNVIVPITLWSLNTALRQCGEYFARFPGFSVAVNLSPVTLNDPDIFEFVKQAANIWCTGQEQLTLEITEGALMEDPVAATRILDQLHDQGIRLSIDDFGTGYSSLSQISRLRVSELKIDKSFVSGVTAIERNAQIVRAVIDLAHNFGMTVVAEGIEDEQTLAFLATMGCDYGQGYYIGRPMPISQLEDWLANMAFLQGYATLGQV